MRSLILRTSITAALAACGPTQVNVAPVKIQPIHVTVDVNLHDAARPAPPPPPPK